jgi:hypothetical protein
MVVGGFENLFQSKASSDYFSLFFVDECIRFMLGSAIDRNRASFWGERELRAAIEVFSSYVENPFIAALLLFNYLQT